MYIYIYIYIYIERERERERKREILTYIHTYMRTHRFGREAKRKPSLYNYT